MKTLKEIQKDFDNFEHRTAPYTAPCEVEDKVMFMLQDLSDIGEDILSLGGPGSTVSKMEARMEKARVRAHVVSAQGLFHEMKTCPANFIFSADHTALVIREHLKLGGFDAAVLDTSGRNTAQQMEDELNQAVTNIKALSKPGVSGPAYNVASGTHHPGGSFVKANVGYAPGPYSNTGIPLPAVIPSGFLALPGLKRAFTPQKEQEEAQKPSDAEITAFFAAAKIGNAPALDKFLKDGMPVNILKDNQTALDVLLDAKYIAHGDARFDAGRDVLRDAGGLTSDKLPAPTPKGPQVP